MDTYNLLSAIQYPFLKDSVCWHLIQQFDKGIMEAFNTSKGFIDKTVWNSQ